MTKWDYIRLISKRGNDNSGQGGVLDMLEWCNKPNTASVSMEEAKAFWERFKADEGLSSGVASQ